jgi:hypothetical protein
MDSESELIADRLIIAKFGVPAFTTPTSKLRLPASSGPTVIVNGNQLLLVLMKLGQPVSALAALASASSAARLPSIERCSGVRRHEILPLNRST